MRISASLPEPLWARVKQRSETMGQSASWQLKQALTKWLDEQEAAHGQGSNV